MRRVFAIGILGLLGLGVAIAPVSAQAVPKNAVFGSITIRSGFRPDPQELRGISGGEVAAMDKVGVRETPTGACLGFVDEHPDHRLKLNSFFNYLKLAVESKGDTVLVVRGPGGVWCNDDSQNQNPVIAGEWKAGDYEVWVGSRNRDSFYNYVLEITQVK